MKPLSEKAQRLLDAVPDFWIAPWHLQDRSGLTLGDYYSYISVLTRRGLIERNDLGEYRRAGGAS